MDFLDKMKDGITKGIDTVSAKGKDMMEDVQAHLAIRNLQSEREKAVAELGALAFALFQKGALADEGAKKVCESIASLDQQIAAKEAEIEGDKA
jgi:alpha-D-ribose 1-methylphosphonate 5-triphosphate synthase subunit PhnG